MVSPVGAELGSSGSSSRGPLEILYEIRASSPSRGCPVIHDAWLSKMRSPSATSSGPTVQTTTMLVFPRSDIAHPSLVRSANWVRVRRRGGDAEQVGPLCRQQVRDVHGGPGGRGRDRVESFRWSSSTTRATTFGRSRADPAG